MFVTELVCHEFMSSLKVFLLLNTCFMVETADVSHMLMGPYDARAVPRFDVHMLTDDLMLPLATLCGTKKGENGAQRHAPLRSALHPRSAFDSAESSNIWSFSTMALTSHVLRSWWNADAPLNIEAIDVTPLVRHRPIAWLKATARENIAPISRTFCVRHRPIAWLKPMA